MPASKQNPYESPADSRQPVTVQRKRTWWHRLIPTAVFGLLGSCSLSLGLVYTISLLRWLAGGGQLTWWWCVSMLVFFGTGTAWVLAGWLFLKKRSGAGTIAAVVGFVILLSSQILSGIWR